MSNASCVVQAMLCRTVHPGTAVCHCLAIVLCCVYMAIQVLETFVKVKCTTQCTQGNINCLATCNVKHTLHMEPSAQENLLSHKVHTLKHHYFSILGFFAKLQKIPVQLGTLGQWSHSKITN